MAVRKQIESAQSSRRELDETISRLEKDRKQAAGGEETKGIDSQLEIARQAREFANRIAAGRTGLDRRPRRGSACMENHSGRG